MVENGTKIQVQDKETKPKPASPPLVFISHDGRDAELAEAFSKLLGSISAGMLKSFRSSAKKGREGIDFGDEWYKQLMKQLDLASDVVCLLTERSLERPWILYEAGVAKGKLNKPVFGVVIGLPLSKVGVGPFYQFQNCDDSEESLKKLIMQLAGRVPGLAPDSDVVETQVRAFKAKVDEILSKIGQPTEAEETPSESSTARVLEELKIIVRDLPRRLEKRLSAPRLRERQLKLRSFHPKFFREFFHIFPDGPENPIAILMLTSYFREEAPWLEVLGQQAYYAIQSGNRPEKKRAIMALRHGINFITRTPMGEELFSIKSEEDLVFLHDTMSQLENTLEQISLSAKGGN